MTQVFNGEHRDLEARGRMTVNGALDGGVVFAGASLTVNGAATGHFRIEVDGLLIINGAVAGMSADNEGLIMVAGAIEQSSRELDGMGNFAVLPGSIIFRRVLEHTGRLHEPTTQERTNLSVDGNAANWCVWLAEEQAFVPMSEIQRRTDEADAASDD